MSRIAELVSLGLVAQEPPQGLVEVNDSLRAQTPQQRFECGERAMASLLRITALLRHPRGTRREALRAGLSLSLAAYRGPELEALAKQIANRLSRAQRKELSRLCAQLEQPEVQLDAYLDTLELCLLRAGLLLADDLRTALVRISGSAGGELETFAGAPRALDLLRFWLSPRLLELRAELGWGP